MEKAILILLLGILLGAALMPTLAFASHSSPFQSKVAMINKIPTQKVRVGDIDIAYKQLGKSNAKPIILITGLGATMDTWSPPFVRAANFIKLSCNYL
jgi:hypothetical protein